jgi:hypothetical protein
MKYLSQRNGYYWLRIKPKKALLPYLPIEIKEYLLSLGNVSLVETERKADLVLTRSLEEIELANPGNPNRNKRSEMTAETGRYAYFIWRRLKSRECCCFVC